MKIKKDGAPVKIKRAIYNEYRNKFSATADGRMQWCVLGTDGGVIDTVIPLKSAPGGCGMSATVTGPTITKAFQELVAAGKKFKGFLALPSQGIHKARYKSDMKDLHMQYSYLYAWHHYAHVSCCYMNLYGTPFIGRSTRLRQYLLKLEIVP